LTIFEKLIVLRKRSASREY